MICSIGPILGGGGGGGVAFATQKNRTLPQILNLGLVFVSVFWVANLQPPSPILQINFTEFTMKCFLSIHVTGEF